MSFIQFDKFTNSVSSTILLLQSAPYTQSRLSDIVVLERSNESKISTTLGIDLYITLKQYIKI